MPHIRVSNLEPDLIKSISEDLCNIIAEDSKASIEYIKVFYSPTKYIPISKNEALFPMIDIYWMPRPQEICDKVALSITKYFKARGYNSVQVTFTEFKGNLFYENGVHY